MSCQRNTVVLARLELPNKQLAIKRLLKDTNLDLILIQETKQEEIAK